MKKKYTSLIAVSLIVALLLTTAASASFIDGLQYFVTEGYQGREQLLGFFMIFLIFFSVLFGALQKTTFKDQKNASIVIAFCVALISAISIISQIEFSISGFRYIAEGLFFLLLVILIYSLLVKIGMEKNKFFAFILAILIAAFLIFLVNRLIEEGPGNMFEGLGSDLNFGGVGLGREKAKKSLTPEELEDLKLQWVEENLVKKSIEKELNKLKGDIQTTTDPEKYRSIRNELRSKRSESKSSTKRIKDIHNDLEDNNVPEEELAGLMPVEPPPKKGSNIIWIILVIALTLTGAGILIAKNRDKLEGIFKKRETSIIENALEILDKLLERSIKLQKRIMDDFNNKIKHDILLTKEEKEGYKFPDPDPAWFYTEENKENTIKIYEELKKLFKLNKELLDEISKEMDFEREEYKKEGGILRYLAQELVKEKQYINYAKAYYAGEVIKDKTGVYDPIAHEKEWLEEEKNKKGGYPYKFFDKEHHRALIIHPSLLKSIKSIEYDIQVDEKIKTELVQKVAPVIVRLHQLFIELKDILEKEEKPALDSIEKDIEKLKAEQEGREKLNMEVYQNMKPLIDKFVRLVKDKEWVIYKNLQKDHNDKQGAKDIIKKLKGEKTDAETEKEKTEAEAKEEEAKRAQEAERNAKIIEFIGQIQGKIQEMAAQRTFNDVGRVEQEMINLVQSNQDLDPEEKIRLINFIPLRAKLIRKELWNQGKRIEGWAELELIFNEADSLGINVASLRPLFFAKRYAPLTKKIALEGLTLAEYQELTKLLDEYKQTLSKAIEDKKAGATKKKIREKPKAKKPLLAKKIKNIATKKGEDVVLRLPSIKKGRQDVYDQLFMEWKQGYLSNDELKNIVSKNIAGRRYEAAILLKHIKEGKVNKR